MSKLQILARVKHSSLLQSKNKKRFVRETRRNNFVRGPSSGMTGDCAFLHHSKTSITQAGNFTIYFSDEPEELRVVARATLTHPQGGCGLNSCRVKRDEQTLEEREESRALHIHLETPKVIFKHQENENMEPIFLRLRPVDPSTLLSPNYKLVVRGRDSEAVEVNRTLPQLDCHYRGIVDGLENSSVVAFSICDNNLVS
jgi:hypothetical protein